MFARPQNKVSVVSKAPDWAFPCTVCVTIDTLPTPPRLGQIPDPEFPLTPFLWCRHRVLLIQQSSALTNPNLTSARDYYCPDTCFVRRSRHRVLNEGAAPIEAQLTRP